MNRRLTRDWLWQSPFLHRRRSLQAPISSGLLAALVFDSGSGLFPRRELAVVKASERKADEAQQEFKSRLDLRAVQFGAARQAGQVA